MRKHYLTLTLLFIVLCGCTIEAQTFPLKFDTLVPFGDGLSFAVNDSVVYLEGLVVEKGAIPLGGIEMEKWPKTKINYLRRDYNTGETEYLNKHGGTVFRSDTTGYFYSGYISDKTTQNWRKRLRAGLTRKNPVLKALKFEVRHGSRLKENIPLEEIVLLLEGKLAFFVTKDSTLLEGPPEMQYRQSFYRGKYHLFYDPITTHRVIMNRKGEVVLKDEEGVADAVWEMALPIVSIDDYDNLDVKYIYDLEKAVWLDTVEVAKRLTADTYYTSSMDGIFRGEVDLWVRGVRQPVTNFSTWPIQLKQFGYETESKRIYRKMNGDTLWVEPAPKLAEEKQSRFISNEWLLRGQDSILSIRTTESMLLPMISDFDQLQEIIFHDNRPVYAWCGTNFVDDTGEYRYGLYMIDLQRQLVSPVMASIFYLQDNIFVVRNWNKEVGLVAWR